MVFSWRSALRRKLAKFWVGGVMVGKQMLEVANPAEALRNQKGKFKVISPNGYIFQVTCRKGTKIRIREIGASEPNTFSQLRGWRIEKIA